MKRVPCLRVHTQKGSQTVFNIFINLWFNFFEKNYIFGVKCLKLMCIFKFCDNLLSSFLSSVMKEVYYAFKLKGMLSVRTLLSVENEPHFLKFHTSGFDSWRVNFFFMSHYFALYSTKKFPNHH